MAQSHLLNVLITGATGRVGTLLRKAWAVSPPVEFRPVWSSRSVESRPDWIVWDMGSDTLPVLDPPPRAILHLARGTGRDCRQVSDIHMDGQALRLAQLHVAPLLIASSVAVYGSSSEMMSERAALSPQTRNGWSKLRQERELSGADKVCFLRLGNVVGADGLIGASSGNLVLDRGDGSDGGPVRSWIGPRTLATVLAHLLALCVSGRSLPQRLNVAQAPALGMAELADADQRRWRFSDRMADVGCVRVDCSLLRSTIGKAIAPAEAAVMVAEWRTLAAVCV